jgi:hypothetical protein
MLPTPTDLREYLTSRGVGGATSSWTDTQLLRLRDALLGLFETQTGWKPLVSDGTYSSVVYLVETRPVVIPVPGVRFSDVHVPVVRKLSDQFGTVEHTWSMGDQDLIWYPHGIPAFTRVRVVNGSPGWYEVVAPFGLFDVGNIPVEFRETLLAMWAVLVVAQPSWALSVATPSSLKEDLLSVSFGRELSDRLSWVAHAQRDWDELVRKYRMWRLM